MAALAAAAVLPILMALTRAQRGPAEARRPAVAIYSDQLDEIGRDLDRGLIGESEATAARTEIARRLIRAGDEQPAAGLPAGGRRARRLAAITVLAAPVVALVFYLAVGSPQLPDEPLAARLAAPTDKQDIATLVARVEKHLAANPDDGAGWQVLAPVYFKLGRYDDAVHAYSNSIRLLGATAGREADLGEAMVAANGGAVSEEARAAFQRASALAPDDPRPKFYLALALGQEGKRDQAIAAWQGLLADAPKDAPWLPAARTALARLQAAGGTATAPGPTAADMAAAQNLTPDQRLAMIEGMVATLAARLHDHPTDADGWARLIHSYMVLNRPADARDALARARAALAGDASKLAVVETEARQQGLADEERQQ